MKSVVHEHHWGDTDRNNAAPSTVIEAVRASRVIPAPRSSPQLKADLLKWLRQHGWAGEVEIDAASSISITSIKDRTGLCFQTGNMARMYADLLKLQAVFARRVIDRGVFVIPTKHCAKVLGSNVANYERLKRELAIFDAVITMPLLVIGIE